MKKSKINALLAAGAVAFFVPNTANAAALDPIVVETDATLNTSSGGDTFSTITVNGAATYTINSTNGSLTPTPGTGNGVVNMNNASTINLSPAVQAITFNSVTANGNNTITHSSSNSTGSNLGEVNVTEGSTLTITNNSGTLNAGATTLTGGDSTNQTATLKINGSNVVTVNGVDASGNSTIEVSGTGYQNGKLGGINAAQNSNLNLKGVSENITLQGNGNANLNLQNSTIGLNATSAALNVNGTTALNGGSTININGTHGVSFTNGVTVSGTGNIIANSTSSINEIAYETSGELTTNGSQNITKLNATGTEANSSINNTGTVQIGELQLEDGVNFEVKSSGNTTTIGNVTTASGNKNLTLNAYNGNISVTNKLTFNGNNDQLTITGSKNIDLAGGMEATGARFTLNNQKSGFNAEDINVASGQDYIINASANTEFGDAILATGKAPTSGSPADTTGLHLNTNGGNITGDSVTMNGYGTLNANASGSNKVTITKGVTVKGTNNYITATNGADLNKITMGDSNNPSNPASVRVNGLRYGTDSSTNTANFEGFTFNANNNEIIAEGSSTLGDLNLTIAGQDLTIQTTAGTESNVNKVIFANANLAAGVPPTTGETPTPANPTTLTLSASADNSILDGNQVTLNGYGNLNMNNVTVEVVNVNGQNNNVSGTTDAVVGSLTFNADNTTNDYDVRLSNINVIGTTNVGNNVTIESADTSFNNLNVTNSKTLNLNSTGNTTVTASNVSNGSNINVTTSAGKETTFTTLRLNGGNATSKFNGSGTNKVTTLNITSSVNKVINNGNKQLEIETAAYQANNSAVTFEGDAAVTNLNLYGSKNTITNSNSTKKLTVTNINQNGANNLDINGGLDITNLNINSSNPISLIALSGDTEIDNFVKDPKTNPNMNLALDAQEGASITKTQTTTLTNGDTLTLAGAGNITMTGGVNIGQGTLNVQNKNANVGPLVIANSGILDTATGSTETKTLTVDSLTVGTQSTDSANWNFAFDATNKTADKISFNEGGGVTPNSGKLNVTMAPVLNPSGMSNYVQYVQLVDDTTNSVLNNTGEESKNYIAVRSDGGIGTYYSYVTPNTKENHNYLPNRIRVTNYNIADNTLLDAVTKEGVRTWVTENSAVTSASYAAKSGNTNLPNLQANENFAVNRLIVANLGALSGYNDLSGTVNRAQLFDVDTRDGIARSLYIMGTPIKWGLSDSTVETRVNNHGNGAALHIVSSTDETNLADSSVYITSYTENDTTTYPAFVGNEARGIADNINQGNGGAIYAQGNATQIVANVSNVPEGSSGLLFEHNIAHKAGGAIYNTDGATISLSADKATFNENTAGTGGGAIYNTNASLGIGGEGLSQSFTNNRSGVEGSVIKTYDPETREASYDYSNKTYTTSGGNGGAINNTNNGVLAIAGNTTFDRNIAGSLISLEAGNTSSGGAIYNDGAMLLVGDENSNTTFNYNEAFGNGGAVAAVNNNSIYQGNTTFTDNIATGNGGAVSAIGTPADEATGTEAINTEVSFVGSQTFSDNLAQGKGGAIYGKNATINIVANNGKNTTFTGNKQNVVYSTTPGEGQSLDPDCGHAIDDATGKHVIASSESNAIYLDGDTTLNLTTKKGSKIHFNDKIASAGDNNKIVQNGTVYYHPGMDKHDGTPGFVGSFDLNSGKAYFTDPESRPFQKSAYKLNGDTLLAMKNGVIIPVKATSVDLTGTSKKHPANLTIDLNLKTKKSDTFVITDNSKTKGGFINVSEMNIKGDTSEEKVFYNIAKGANVTTPIKKYNGEIYKYNVTGGKSGITFNRGNIHGPLVAPQVAVNARLAGQLSLFNDVLHRVDEIAETRYFHKASRENLYAADPDVLDDRRIDNGYTAYVNQEDGGSAWVKPSFTIERINPKGYHKYHNKAYNAILGYEMPVATLRNGWDLINTVFLGYQGSNQHYDDFRNYQNGGTAGYMANLYHNNFFSGAVVMLGGSAVETNDKAGLNRDMNYGLFDVGASARVGYNIGLGKHWLFQPMYTMSYIYISGIDRHNHRGQHINLKGTNTLQIAPGFKLVGNYGGWQPYLLFDYTWPCIAKTVANVNNIGIPDLKLRSYVEYGAGLRKNLGERFTGYAEAVMRNGGRTGVSFQGGLTFKF